MSKNPAWNAHNEAVRKANEAYEEKVKPLRIKLSTDITVTEKRFDDKINPLVFEKKKLIEDLKKEYTDAISAAEKERNSANKRAQDVLRAELKASEKTKEEVKA